MNKQNNLWAGLNPFPDKVSNFEIVMNSHSIDQFKDNLRAFHCTRCPLSREIEQNPTTSRGNSEAKVMLVGEAPGHNEMLQGIPFVGKAGQLMDKLFESVGLFTNQYLYVSNICRCRPVNNRAPKVAEAKTCIVYLKKEIELIKPRFILLMGITSSKYLLGDVLPSLTMEDLAGKFYKSQEFPEIEFMILYHPAALLYNPKLKEPMNHHIGLFKERLDSLS